MRIVGFRAGVCLTPWLKVGVAGLDGVGDYGEAGFGD
jgi:hypothetical protein